jgi:hypothetical protein
VNDSVAQRILTELEGIRSTMATKEELEGIRSSMATKEELQSFRSAMNGELQDIRSTMATKEELQKGFKELAELIKANHIESIRADESLLEAIRMTNQKLDFKTGNLEAVVQSHDHQIRILHRKQLELEAEIEHIKRK